MSVVHPLQPRQEHNICPDCGAPEGLFKDSDNHVACKLCDWQSSETIGLVNIEEQDFASSIDKYEFDVRDLRNFQRVSYYVQDRDRITIWGMSAYESALDHLRNQEWDEAIVDLYRALDMDSGFPEVHLWLGRLLRDEDKQREHLIKVSKRPQAILELMYLDGRISLTQLENALYSDGESDAQVMAKSVEAETIILTCPICGGHMTAHPITGHVECAYCGHILDEVTHEIPEADTVKTGFLLKQTQDKQWVINERIIHCENCGASRTLTDDKMGAYCLYCGSQHIIIQDALNSFRQPDSIIPFTVPQDQAEKNIHDRLFARWERFKGMFTNNTVKQATFTGMYVPFWIFKIPLSLGSDYYVFPAVLSPSPLLIDKIDEYDLSKIQTYSPASLASYSAEMYQVDFDKASLSVRGYLKRVVPDDNPHSSTMVEVSYRWAILNDTTYQLVLLPIWIATLLEDDGDVRIGLVNGQTGRAVLGKARKPNRYK